MPDHSFQAGIDRLKTFLSQFSSFRSLSREELDQFRKDFTDGWEIFGICADPSLALRILIPPEFPSRPPRIAVHPAPPVLTWPNLESNGLLCLMQENALFSTERPEDVLRDLLHDAQTLVNECLSGHGLERFEDEFQSYWSRWPSNDGTVISLCSPGGPTRWVSICTTQSRAILADDEPALKTWVKNRFGADEKFEVSKAPFILLSKPPHPSNYPENIGQLIQLINVDRAAVEMVKSLFSQQTKGTQTILLGFQGRTGFGFAALRFYLNCGKKDLGNGFRKGKVPAQIVLMRSRALSISGKTVKRCDHLWVHGRDHNADLATLTGKKVIVFGVGSVGSGVAELLAKAGVSKITLVDPESLGTENASRHSLGIDSQGLEKAPSLAKTLARRFPHLKISGFSQTSEKFVSEQLETVLDADLIVSTIGGWASENFLTILANNNSDFPPMLFGWLEPNAVAGHAIVFFGENGCLRCIMDDMGNHVLPVTCWPETGTALSVPMCGGMFQAYGAIELSFSQALVADLAIDVLLEHTSTTTHRTWVGQAKLLRDTGSWNPDWVAVYGHPGNGGKSFSAQFHKNPDCPVCREI